MAGACSYAWTLRAFLACRPHSNSAFRVSQERIELVSAEFEQCTAEWHTQLATEAAKWEKQAQQLRQRVGTEAELRGTLQAREKELQDLRIRCRQRVRISCVKMGTG